MAPRERERISDVGACPALENEKLIPRRALSATVTPEVRALRRDSGAEQASKGDGPAAESGAFILRGSPHGALRRASRTSG